MKQEIAQRCEGEMVQDLEQAQAIIAAECIASVLDDDVRDVVDWTPSCPPGDAPALEGVIGRQQLMGDRRYPQLLGGEARHLFDSSGAGPLAMAVPRAVATPAGPAQTARGRGGPRGARDALTPAKVYEKQVTSLMILGLPRTLTQEELATELQVSGFAVCYDYLYMPVKIPSTQNLGYAFVNFRSLESSSTFVNMWGDNCCGRRYCRLGRLSIVEAAKQGLEAQAGVGSTGKMRRIKNPRFR
eukprot:CAMPEP_0178384502 /NCGR_PEP_ID=MMETSP0689_2-20121128/7547_1 /TAXON_ID=160604 /ORGANISM="Amphidinium massartii, Strain CS-259" /LENGTH=242 /DNA_ID=CAMNT_0020004749 /DNA_START=355 /DNA_END=1080 /DNA_ORIENTATION=+